MNRSFGTFTTGMVAGLVVGSATAMLMRPQAVKKMASAKKKASRTIRAIGNALDSMNL